MDEPLQNMGEFLENSRQKPKTLLGVKLKAHKSNDSSVSV